MTRTPSTQAPSMIRHDATRRRLIQGAALGAATTMFLPRWIRQAAAAEAGVLTVVIPSNPTTFDPINQSNHDAMVVNQLIFENLVEIDGNGQQVPMLAKSWTISKDQLTYTFELRDDVTFQNGQKFTAEDVKYSYEYILNPANRALRRPMWTPIDSITVESPTRVVFKMNTRTGPSWTT